MDFDFLFWPLVLVLAIPVAIIVQGVMLARLRHRAAELEQLLSDTRARLRLLEEAPPARSASSTDEVPAEAPPSTEAAPAIVGPEPALVTGPPPAGPWMASSPPPEPPPIPAPSTPPASVRATSPFAGWLRQNWVYVIAAASLGLAGIFFVQYGMERGLLPPVARVAMAILFGMALVAGGEWLRRRAGDGPGAPTTHIPSVLAGAGIVSMFAGVIAARWLYDLIGPEATFAGLVAVAALAVLLGWFYGPYLAAVGLVGAAAAPFLVGGTAQAPDLLFAYYVVLAAAGLLIDTLRRWAWLSVLALALGYGGVALVWMGGGAAGWFFLAAGILPVIAILIPARGLVPDQAGPMVSEIVAARSGALPFPTGLAAGCTGLSVAFLVWAEGGSTSESILAFATLGLLAGAMILWSVRARALSDLAALPAVGFLGRLMIEGHGHGVLATDYATRGILLRPPESAPPMTAAWLLGAAAILALLAAWRSGRTSEYRAIWAAAAAIFAPLVAVVLELFWAPAAVLGAYPWALQVIALAALMTFVAARFAAADGQDRRRAAYATLSVLSLIALALFLVLTKGALTLALAVLVTVATGLDRRFRLREMGWFIQAAILVLGWRLVADPGLDWAVNGARLWEVIAAYGGAALAMQVARTLLHGLDRPLAEVLLGSAGAAFTALFANVLITRWLVAYSDANWAVAHWGVMLNALPWLILALTQLYRLKLGGWTGRVRVILAGAGGILFAGGVAVALSDANPMWGHAYPESVRLVLGPPLADTLFVAYGLPALILLASLGWLGHLPRQLRLVLMAVGLALATLYVAFEIRRLWQGRDLSAPGVMQGELYSYTIAMMLVGAGLLWQAIARQSATLRRVAMAVIGVTIAKVFLIDASGLSGLTRVFSFLGLGLSLLVLAWLNRWATARQADTAR